MEHAALIEFHEVSKGYGKLLALDHLTWAVPAGTITALAGHNGAGKTTCLRLITGLLTPDSGKVNVLGLSPGRRTWEIRRRISYLPDEPFTNPHLTGTEHLAFHADVYGQSEAFKQALALAERYHLREALDRPVRTYSRGMLQRLGLIRALMVDVPILLLDEPFNALDPVALQLLCSDLQQRAAGGTCVLLTSHHLEMLRELASQIIVLKEGQLVYQGPPAAVDWTKAIALWFARDVDATL
ncbi:ABC transporter ATP-binding protein [Thermogemmatispora carboxidivorans]|uniref:ABC transporter ATP-binding protein n=1 Tax=Thermogemmatispora carboxidivorans TaxID=1382306 RepID=UPI00069947DB|nr:ABC transporter ATP-binding protein [Thermogemmatispora carboxidivorans]